MEDELIKPHIGSEDGIAEVSSVPMDIEPSTDEDKKTIQNPEVGELAASEGDGGSEPYEGMEFESEEAAKTFYGAYARRVGFRIRISRYTRSRRDNSIISRRIVCSKEGFREARANDGLFSEQRLRQRAVTRIGCKAMIMVKKFGTGRWIVTKFVKEHNHGPVPPRKVEVRTVRRDDDLLEKSYFNDGDARQEPYEGMEFESEEAAKLFYIAYARHMGFRARISKYCRSRRDNSIISRQIVCSKEGFREDRVKKEAAEEGKAKRSRVITRIGCKAMIIVKKVNSGRWVVTKFEKEHNHPLLPTKNYPHLESHNNAGKVINLQGAMIKANGTVSDGSCAGTRGTSGESLTVLYNQLCYEAIKYAQEGAATEDSYNVAMSALKEAVEKVAAAKRTAATTAQQRIPISGTTQAFIVAQGNNLNIMAQTKALQELQSSNELMQAITAQDLKFPQQPVTLVLIPSTLPNDSSTSLSTGGPLVLNLSNGQISHNPPDGIHTANSSQGMSISTAVTVLKQVPPPAQFTQGSAGSASECSNVPTEVKRQLHTVDQDAEHDDAVHRSQKLEPAGAGHTVAAPKSGTSRVNPVSSEAQMMAIPALPVTLYMPLTGGLPASCSAGTPGTPSCSYALVATPIEALPVSSCRAETGIQPQDASMQTAPVSKSGTLALTISDQCKSYTGPNPLVHATAIACGARVVPQKEAASLIKAIESRIKSGGASNAKSALTGGFKPLAADAQSQPSDIEEGKREPIAVGAVSDEQVAVPEEKGFHESVVALGEMEVDTGHSVVGDVGQNHSLIGRQLELPETVGAAEDLPMFESRAWAEIKL